MKNKIQKNKAEKEELISQNWDESDCCSDDLILIEQIPAAIFVTDLEFRIRFVNSHFVKMTGYSCKDLFKKNIFYLMNTSTNSDFKLQDDEIKIQDVEWSKDLSIILKNGNVEYVKIEIRSQKNAKSEIIGYLGTCTIACNHKEAEISIIGNENIYRTLVENSHQGILIVNKNKTLFANDTFSKMLGYSHEELFHFPSSHLIFEEDMPKIEKIASRRNNQDFLPIQEYFTLIAKDGTTRECEAISTLIQFKGEWCSFFSVHDITENKRIELELKRSEQRYRELSEMLPLAVYELDANGSPTYMNQTGLKLFGIEKGSSKGKKATGFFSKEDSELMQQKLKEESERLMSDGETFVPMPSPPAEYIAKRSDGSDFPVLIYGTSIVEDGKVVGSRGIIVDISERKDMENALRESEQKYKTIIENSQDGIFAIQGDKILFTNNTVCKMLGYTPEEMYLMPAYELLYSEDKAKGLAISQQRKSGDYSTLNDIFRFQAKDGSIKETDVFSSVIELNGQMVSLITVHDLTNIRKIQEQLRMSEEKYRTLIENANDGIVITQDGMMRFYNKAMASMLQIDLEEYLNKPFLEKVVPEDHQVMIEYHKRRMAGEDFASLYRSRLIRKDGKILTVELNARTSNYNGRPAAFIMVRDISDRIKIEQELQIAKNELELLNFDLEKRVIESTKRLTETQTQLINLQKENLQTQYDVLKQQVNPHFLFNSLNVLTSLIKLEPDLAEKFSEQLSKVYRYVLENKDRDLVELNTELNFLEAYLFLLNIRFLDKLVVNLTISPEKRVEKIIPLAMQLLIENAIKHNVMTKQNPLIIDIFIDDDNYLNIINNLQERPSQIISTGVGLKNIFNRYQLLNMNLPVFEKTDKQFIAKIQLIKNT